MIRSAVLGFPRMGPNRELKFALESHWAGESNADELLTTARGLRRAAWERMKNAGIDVIPSGDFSLYDHMLDTIWGLGAIPERFGSPATDDLAAYFRLARGSDTARPLEMTKWFDTNYHYLVPELHPEQQFEARPDHWVAQYGEAKALGIETRPVIVGPFTFLRLAKGLEQPYQLLDRLLPVYEEILNALGAAGAHEVQIDEPALVLDQSDVDLEIFENALTELATSVVPALTLTTCFAGLDQADTLKRLARMPLHEVHLDLVRAPEQLRPALDFFAGAGTRLSLGLVDGRNVWITDPDPALVRFDSAAEAIGEDRLTISPSCSLLHMPFEAAAETGVDPEVRDWLAFATERLDELTLLKRAATASAEEREPLLAPAREKVAGRRESIHTSNPAVRDRVASLEDGHYGRSRPYSERRVAQRERQPLPELPTTTIGSFPQTGEIREARRKLRLGEIGRDEYERMMEGEIRRVVDFQEEIGLDMLVHGEPERNDMVEYFGQQLDGFTFSANGWVQSYGSRCVKPPILYGDVSRPEPMTVEWWRKSQAMTEKPMKGMLTGPVTILQWSFVRDDQPRKDTCTQIALAIQDEVLDLEAAGAFAIQVDEAALREGLPLQQRHRDDYVRWAVDCFRLTVAPAAPDTQIHTHMCYSEFNEMMEHIIRLDADVLSIEASRSGMEVLDVFAGETSYPNEIGPGIYDIHSPRVPDADEIEKLLIAAEERIGRDRLWVNPDCGLKTRKWEEVRPALEAMMEATRRRRKQQPNHRGVV
ncbi:MAG: 5-methyltetrahydropteroyltriglutamate--homocysteine S-methyltransferase [Solirubrobacterales bacterium]|nr:5-methyltetrahydropteroyltriglutamate--homocysteine S-methyltransferase [Solirubrobacterales bacterium]